MPPGSPPLGSPTSSATWPPSPVAACPISPQITQTTNISFRLVGSAPLRRLAPYRLPSAKFAHFGASTMMRRAVKALPWARSGEQQQGMLLWQRAMATKLDGSTKSGVDESSPGANPAEREAFKSDMDTSYGDAYSTRSSDEGYGERYGEAVKVVLEKKQDTRELQRGETAERDQNQESVKQVHYDTSQGEHVEQKEVARHSEKDRAFEGEHAAHRAKGGHGGAAT